MSTYENTEDNYNQRNEEQKRKKKVYQTGKTATKPKSVLESFVTTKNNSEYI